LTDGTDDGSSSICVVRFGGAGWEVAVALIIYYVSDLSMSRYMSLTEVTALFGTPVGGTETTSSERCTDTVCSTVLVGILTSSDGLEDVTCVLSGPLFPKLDSSSGHGGWKKGLRSSRSG